MAQDKTIIVIGGNAAGPAAAAKAKRTDPSARVLLFEQGEYISTGTCEMPYIISGEIPSYKDIVFFDPVSFRKAKDVEVFIRQRADEIDRKNCIIKVSDLESRKTSEFRYDTLVLATGSSAVKLPMFDNSSENLFYMKTVGDLIRLEEYIRTHTPKTALIVGSGYIGLEMCEALVRKGLEVTLIDKAELPFPQADAELQHLIKEVLTDTKIRFYGNQSGLKPYYSGSRIKSIKADGRAMEFDIVLSAAGVVPNTRLALQSRLATGRSGALQTDKKLRTSDQKIYAAGDNIEVTDFLTGRSVFLPFATLAQKGGHIAGENAAGGNKHLGPVIRNTAFRFFDNSVVITGLTEKEALAAGFRIKTVHAVSANLIKVFPGSRNVFGKLIYEADSRRLLGCSFIGGNETAGYGDLISALIRGRSDARMLAELDFNYTPPISPFVNLLSILGRKAV